MRQWKEYITSGQILQNPTSLTTKKSNRLQHIKKDLTYGKR